MAMETRHRHSATIPGLFRFRGKNRSHLPLPTMGTLDFPSLIARGRSSPRLASRSAARPAMGESPHYVQAQARDLHSLLDEGGEMHFRRCLRRANPPFTTPSAEGCLTIRRRQRSARWGRTAATHHRTPVAFRRAGEKERPPLNAALSRPRPASRGGIELWTPVIDALGKRVNSELQKQAFQRDPAFVEQFFSFARTLNLYFSTEFRGWEHVPRDRPSLIVGNHSGGAESVDFWFLFYKWVRERGAEAPLYSLAYNLIFSAPLLGSPLRRLGIIPASQKNARSAIAMGATVAVFPGEDHEVFRPWRERNRIDFADHTGFIALALATRTPVVPMTIHGAHESTLVLTRGQAVARATGL